MMFDFFFINIFIKKILKSVIFSVYSNKKKWYNMAMKEECIVYKNSYIRSIFVFLFIILSVLTFRSYVFAVVEEQVKNEELNDDKENIEKKQLLEKINNRISDMKKKLQETDKLIDNLKYTQEYENYPAVRLNVDTPFFGLDAILEKKLKINSEVSTVDVASGYSIRDILNNNSIKLPDFKVGNIIVSTKDVKIDENLSNDDARIIAFKLVQYTTQINNTNDLITNRINNVFENYIPKEKS